MAGSTDESGSSLSVMKSRDCLLRNSRGVEWLDDGGNLLAVATGLHCRTSGATICPEGP